MRVLFGCIVLGIVAASPWSAANGAEAPDPLPVFVPHFESSARAAQNTVFSALDRGIEVPREWAEAPGDGETGRQSYLPVLYSALVPGLGELTMGYWKRGVALMALEVAAWTGYVVKHQDGLDKRDEYEAFADEHWDFDKWIAEHPCPTVPPGGTLEDVEECGRASSGSGAWPGYIPWVSREDDKQHYYENIGKYDWYISGWEDWNGSLSPLSRQTDLRTQYRSMRNESNDALDTATSFTWVSLAARAFSLVETVIIVHNRRENDDVGARSGVPPNLAVRARPRGLDGGEIALVVRFR